jgi:F-type H+/Na+-transporting ATPase subunit alpha
MSANISIAELSKEIKQAINQLKDDPAVETVGVVTKVGDGVAWIYGLTDCGFSEMIEIESISGKPILAFAFNLSEDEIGAVLLGDETDIKAGAKAKLVGKILEVPVGLSLSDELLTHLVSHSTAKVR